MTKLVVVPNELDAAMNAAIDKALAGRQCWPHERAIIRNELLIYFDQHGRLPEFMLTQVAPEAP